MPESQVILLGPTSLLLPLRSAYTSSPGYPLKHSAACPPYPGQGGVESINLFTGLPQGRGLAELGTTITETISLTAVTIIQPSKFNGHRHKWAISILLCSVQCVPWRNVFCLIFCRFSGPGGWGTVWGPLREAKMFDTHTHPTSCPGKRSWGSLLGWKGVCTA